MFFFPIHSVSAAMLKVEGFISKIFSLLLPNNPGQHELIFTCKRYNTIEEVGEILRGILAVYCLGGERNIWESVPHLDGFTIRLSF